ncbi:hypothetical protein EZI54_14275 [Marinobacter halodurans]|uniref:Uncharacterized protein n=1 Tax=Marinobacter halodurans TaxID=2528979 RepID=A0ABY1ZI49_9GAMM|nr:hypothetical protein [Marinobacter halodurans]TBW54276.1 hypothetical protein EZI54_14275 [Marinobacter halodurans]
MHQGDDRNDDPDGPGPGTAPPARTVKAGCGIRFDEEELAEGIAFDGVERLRPMADDSGEDRPVEPDDQSS